MHKKSSISRKDIRAESPNKTPIYFIVAKYEKMLYTYGTTVSESGQMSRFRIQSNQL